MIGFLQRFRVGSRLSMAFGVLIVLSILAIIAGLHGLGQARQQLDNIVQRRMSKIELSQNMLYTAMNIRTLVGNKVQMALSNAIDATGQQQMLADIASQRQQLHQLYSRYQALPHTAADQQQLQTSIATCNGAIVPIDQVLALVAGNGNGNGNGRLTQASALFTKQVEPAMHNCTNSLHGITKRQQQLTHQSYAEAVAAIQQARVLLVCGGLIIFAISAGLAWLITRSLVQPLQVAKHMATSIAAGRIDGLEVHSTAGDEVGELLRAMAHMRDELQAVLDAEHEMAAKNEAGNISFRMDATHFEGAFQRMIVDINALVDGHVKIKLRMAEVIRHYGAGDLSMDMDRLPGEKAAITEALDTTKHNLQAINGEIQRLATAASTGDLSTRGDENAFQHDFRKMIQGLNQLVGVVDSSLAATGSQLRAIASGDLSHRIEGHYQGVFGQLRDDINATTTQLAGIVGHIQQASTAITSAAGEVTSGNDDLSRRTEQQAANLEETAASMEELTSTVKHNAESAAQANQLAQGATAVARDGGEVATQVVTSMQRIETSSKKIAEIISVIDGIAFQTNILALNAAVEAARAGEQGRGFAVVASEVRALSQRSAEAARQIKALIDASVGEVGTGSALVAKAGTTMQDIVTRVQQVTDLIAEISAASQEQSAGIEQVNQTITQMDQATQQNAALVEESNAAAHAMKDQAEALTKAVVVFKLA